MENLSAVLLAAGESKRLGQPKQLVPFNGKPMIQQVVSKLIDAGWQHIVVVLGSKGDSIVDVLQGHELELVFNNNWRKGMGNSLSFGVKAVLKKWPDTENLLISVCDQPFITTAHLIKLKNGMKEAGCSILASGYSDTFGPPIICGAKFFPRLLQLDGEKGAKSVFANHENELKVIPCEEGAIDIDTPEDLNNI